jgi:ribA/ribD-fused uncharacterized protein
MVFVPSIQKLLQTMKMDKEFRDLYCDKFGYVVKHNLCLFQKGPLSQWWGGFKGQTGGFSIDVVDLYFLYISRRRSTKIYSYLEKIYAVDGEELQFNCCEQWMMACKAILFDDPETFTQIMNETSPAKQKELGRSVKNYDNAIWDQYKYEIVARGNEYKFDDNVELKEFLCSFHPFTIFAEAAPWDKVWGIGLGPDDPKALDINTWEGENLLGKAITRLRRAYDDEGD